VTDRPTDRPTDLLRLSLGKISDGHISARVSSDSLHVWFYGRVFGVGRSNGAISGFAKSKMAAKDGGLATILENSSCDVSMADHQIYSCVWFYGGVFWDRGSNGAISGLTKKFNRYVGKTMREE